MRLEDVNLIVGPLFRGKWKPYRLDGDREASTVSATKNPGDAENALASLGFKIGEE